MKRYQVQVETTKSYNIVVEADNQYEIKQEVLKNWKELLTDDCEEDFYIGKITDVSEYPDYDAKSEYEDYLVGNY